ncbi:hypothetical protein AYI68_g2746 [Smittium mucronatum]|uniref:Uncharacterized protein n=1 Tax=Smittium mucronatum TaxID=133383 RepID=A0A1R0H1W9_9FUNG|nr:hypothetical protein AYI68_g2746 [Smittium mucronatum]
MMLTYLTKTLFKSSYTLRRAPSAFLSRKIFVTKSTDETIPEGKTFEDMQNYEYNPEFFYDTSKTDYLKETKKKDPFNLKNKGVIRFKKVPRCFFRDFNDEFEGDEILEYSEKEKINNPEYKIKLLKSATFQAAVCFPKLVIYESSLIKAHLSPPNTYKLTDSTTHLQMKPETLEKTRRFVPVGLIYERLKDFNVNEFFESNYRMQTAFRKVSEGTDIIVCHILIRPKKKKNGVPHSYVSISPTDYMKFEKLRLEQKAFAEKQKQEIPEIEPQNS